MEAPARPTRTTDPPAHSTTGPGVSALPTSTTTTATHRTHTTHTSTLGGVLYAALRAGVLAAVGTWSVVLLPALVGWVAAPESSLGWFSAVQVGTAAWFLGHGQSVGGSGVTISVTPILLLLVFVYVAFRFVRRLVALERGRLSAAAWSRAVRWALAPGFVIGYLGVAGVLALLTLGGPVGPGVAAVLGAGLVPLTALGLVLVRPDEDDAPAFVKTWFRRGPTWLPSAWRIGWRGAGLLLGAGLVVALATVAASWRAVYEVQGEYGLNLAASLILVAGQALFMGNAAIWALSFLAGPGFQVALGGVVSPAAAQPGLLPLVPVLAALPDGVDYPAAMFAVVLVPALAGGLIARWIDAALEFFGNVWARALAMLVAVGLSVGVVTALAALGNGAMGVDRLSDLGVGLGPFAAALFAELAAGAAVWLGFNLWRERGFRLMAVGGDGDDADES